jgi:hypothetical protein
VDIDSLIRYLSALLTPTIATVGAYIAWQQWRLNEQKLRLDLYDRRLKIYQEIRKYISLIVRQGTTSTEELLTFYSSVSEAVFLFESDIPLYIEEIYSHGSALGSAKDQLADRGGGISPEERKRLAAALNIEVRWFLSQSKEATRIFSRYLNLTKKSGHRADET